ncbi:MAG: DUF3090 family protein [Actinomycetota bacterium]|nr:DUF3090 family protein [Actinomycetota bacterium]
MGESYEFDPVEWVSAGAVGRPGRRTFYVQARVGSQVVAVLVEKEQVRLLAQHAQELLARAGVTLTPDDLDEPGHRLIEPVTPAWRVGSMRLGMDDSGRRFLLEAQELLPEEASHQPGTVRLWMSREQLAGLAAYAAFVVEAGARESCRLCGRPIDPVDGHVCPAMDGHGPLTA